MAQSFISWVGKWRSSVLKTIALYTAAICVAFSCSWVQAAPELINGSFEEGGTTSDTAVGWTRWGEWINRETDWKPVRTGQAVLGYHHWQIPSEADSGVWQEVKGLKVGQKVKFSIFMMVDSVSGNQARAEYVELRLEYSKNGWQEILAQKRVPLKDFPTDEAWHAIEVEGVASTEELRVVLSITPSLDEIPKAGAVKFDDAEIQVK